MITVSPHFKQTFPMRAPEWILTGMMTAWGYGVLTHPGMFAENPSFRGMSAILSQSTWGSIALLLGLSGLLGLGINGFWKATPFIRAASSAGRAFVWTQIQFGLMAAGMPTTGVYIYVGLLALEIWNVNRAMGDAAAAVK